jgi:branched-chain amino acid transport system permease protein
MNRIQRRSLFLITFFLLCILAALPLLASSYVLMWIFLMTVYLTLALSYDIVGGFLGYMNLGHSAFFGLGAYISAIALNHDFNLALTLCAAIVFTAAFAAIASYPFFRLRGAYFALGTFALMSLMEVFAANLQHITGGSSGISTPPGNYIVPAYYLSLLAAIGAFILSYFLGRSRFGLALLSIREDEDVAYSFGVPTTTYKSLSLIISSVPASLVGGIYVWNVTYISPQSAFGIEIALSPVVMAMLGGTGITLGPLVGAVCITLIQELLWIKVAYFHLTIYGILLLLVGLFMPGGLLRTRWLWPLVQHLGFGEKIDYFKRQEALIKKKDNRYR